MTRKESVICDKCGEPVNEQEFDDMIEGMFTPYIEVDISSEGMQMISSTKVYHDEVLHFHDDCFDYSIFKELMDE